MEGRTAAPGEFNLFEREEGIAEAAQRALASPALGDDCRAMLAPLLDGYRHLLRETRQLIRIADRRERDLNRLNRKLEALTRTLAYQAEHDPLTGALNKGALHARIGQLLAAGPFSLLIMDIDHFKKINDTFGHLAGDRVLAGLADRLQDMIGEGDALGRFGGEEFIVLSREGSLLKARMLAERLRRGVEAEPFEIDGTAPVPLTLSIGLALADGDASVDTLLARADAALYVAKENGRNRVEVAG
jgi:diguanylate cyclase (GGDEF)-like protein